MNILDFIQSYGGWWVLAGLILAYERYLRAYYSQPKPLLWTRASVNDLWVFVALVFIWPGLVFDRKSSYYASVTYEQWRDRLKAETEAEIQAEVDAHLKNHRDYIESLSKKKFQYRRVADIEKEGPDEATA